MPDSGPPLHAAPLHLGLSVPGQPEFLGVVRLAVAGLCHRLNVPLDRGEDLKMAVDEACSHCIQTLPGLERIALRFEIGRDGLGVRIVPQPAGGPLLPPDGPPPLGLVLMEALVDVVECLENPVGLRLTVTLPSAP